MVYYCEKCKNSFKAGRSTSFVKTTMPKCPYCGSEEISLAKEELTKKDRLDSPKKKI